ncbi:hypothetical protein EXIGLDRAFT_24303 [Exidia glandulosa HHB12029]|uniref:Uncharacterized protein n=1 Tax=Exidia glandulosa HHB12029 TaxID=1314781 RepID=A0A165R1W2_EXIGL|nr:hypothetical protein EXIGLDRAFT_24303 [Exidia glandulosa HHB12029]
MIPLVVAVACGLVSFICSMFVLFRLLLPVLPPHPLSRRVPPSAFGLPNFGSLSPADKSHIYFACIDLLALGAFIWQVVAQQYEPASLDVAHDAASAARLWFASTARQTSMCIVLLITVVHVRRGRTVTLGPFHTYLLVPTILAVALATTLAAIFADVGISTLFVGLTAYTVVIAITSLVAFLTLVRTIVTIRRNLAAVEADNWPPVKEKRRGSFATEDVEALKEGSSWITSHRSSRHNSVSSFAYSVRSALPSSHNSSARDRAKLVGSTATLPQVKNSYWFGMASTPDLDVPPVPALPGQYYNQPSSPVPSIEDDNQDPFRRDEPRFARIPKSSSNSWLTEPSVSQPTLSEFSFPPTTRPSSPVMPTSSGNLLPASATTVAFASSMPHGRVLGGYNYIPELDNRIKGLSSGTINTTNDAPTSSWRAVGWVAAIMVPLVLAVPYFAVGIFRPTEVPDVLSILFILSVTMSSPLLALNLYLHSPVPMPATLFPPRERSSSKATSLMLPGRSVSTGFGPYGGSTRANTPTVIEGRRSGDIWLDRGDAMDGQSRIERVFAMATRVPKLSVLPSECAEPPQLTPPLPMQTRDYSDMTISEGSGFPMEEPSHTARNGKPYFSIGKQIFNQSKKASSYYSGAPSTKYESKILVAERHTSTMALTMNLPPSVPQSIDGDHNVVRRTSVAHSRSQSASSNVMKRTSVAAHSRSQSASSIGRGRFPSSPTPPPDSPLPPTPESLKGPGIRHVRAKSSASMYSFNPITATTQIDGLSAGMLPLLVPGVKVSKDIVRDDWDSRHVAAPVSKHEILTRALPQERSEPQEASTSGRSFGQSQSLSKATKISMAKTSTGTGIYPHSLSVSFSSPEHHSTPPPQMIKRRTSRSRSYHYSLPSLGLGKSANFISEIAAALSSTTQTLRRETVDNRRRTMHGAEYAQLPMPSKRASRASSREPSRERAPAPSMKHRRMPSREQSRAPSTSPEFVTALESAPKERTARRTHRRSLSAGSLAGSLASRRTKSKSRSPMRQPMPPPVVGIDLDDPFVTPSITPTSAVFPDSTRDDASIHSTRRVPVKQPVSARPHAFHLPTTSGSRPPSSVIYIKTNDEPQSAATRTSFAIEEEGEEPIKSPISPWEGILAAAGAIVARAGSSSPEEAKKAPKPLRLLQDRDPNAPGSPISPVLTPGKASVRPLAVKKRSTSNGKQDENSNTTASTSPSIKTLRLVRTATAKARAQWRQNEPLPQVVIRAPSNASTAQRFSQQTYA